VRQTLRHPHHTHRTLPGNSIASARARVQGMAVFRTAASRRRPRHRGNCRTRTVGNDPQPCSSRNFVCPSSSLWRRHRLPRPQRYTQGREACRAVEHFIHGTACRRAVPAGPPSPDAPWPADSPGTCGCPNPPQAPASRQHTEVQNGRIPIPPTPNIPVIRLGVQGYLQDAILHLNPSPETSGGHEAIGGVACCWPMAVGTDTFNIAIMINQTKYQWEPR
jgi:hypothetical protein